MSVSMRKIVDTRMSVSMRKIVDARMSVRVRSAVDTRMVVSIFRGTARRMRRSMQALSVDAGRRVRELASRAARHHADTGCSPIDRSNSEQRQHQPCHRSASPPDVL